MLMVVYYSYLTNANAAEFAQYCTSMDSGEAASLGALARARILSWQSSDRRAFFGERKANC
jgi:hypothetical protein